MVIYKASYFSSLCSQDITNKRKCQIKMHNFSHQLRLNITTLIMTYHLVETYIYLLLFIYLFYFIYAIYFLFIMLFSVALPCSDKNTVYKRWMQQFFPGDQSEAHLVFWSPSCHRLQKNFLFFLVCVKHWAALMYVNVLLISLHPPELKLGYNISFTTINQTYSRAEKEG